MLHATLINCNKKNDISFLITSNVNNFKKLITTLQKIILIFLFIFIINDNNKDNKINKI